MLMNELKDRTIINDKTKKPETKFAGFFLLINFINERPETTARPMFARNGQGTEN